MSDQDATNAIKLSHMFGRLDKLAMCIRGKLQYSEYSDPNKPECLKKGGGYYADYHASDAWVLICVTNERIKQIQNGKAQLRANVVALLRKAPKSTIASLYKYERKLITAVRATAKAEVATAIKAFDIIKKRGQEKANVMTGSVDDLVNRIKDEVSVGTILITALPSILEQFEITQGGTEGFVAHF